MKNLHIGTSGFSYGKWKGIFYPEDLPQKEDLEYYATQFKSVEINNTFYRLPRKSTVEKWLARVPADFVFTFKASRYISHIKRLDVEHDSIELLYGPLEPASKKGSNHCLLFQFPASFKEEQERLERFLKMLPQEKHFRHAFELRHESWFHEETYKTLRKYNVALVMNDSPREGEQGAQKWPPGGAETASFFYIRFHGSQQLYTSRYTDEELDQYAQMLREKLDRGLHVYAYFNNDAAGHAPFDALRLEEKIEKL